MRRSIPTAARQIDPTSRPRTRQIKLRWAGRLLLALCVTASMDISSSSRAAVTTSMQVSMIKGDWATEGDIAFLPPDDSFPLGRLRINGGSASPKGLSFSTGIIEFDVLISSKGPSIGPTFDFRVRDAGTADSFYARPSLDCSAAVDCLQYAPITHGLMMWDAFRRYQHRAPILLDNWNHFKFVISRTRMNVYVNRSLAPDLIVGRLEGDATTGALRLADGGVYANFTVTPGETEGLPDEPSPDPLDQDPNVLRQWQVSQPVVWPTVRDPALNALVGRSVTYTDMPSAQSSWQTIHVERAGLLNLSRAYGLQTVGPEISLTWFKSNITADSSVTKRVRIGWLDEIWVFVNGEKVFSDRNLWDIAGAKKEPDGRLGLDNGSFGLPLRKGLNQIAIAVDDNVSDGQNHHFGWGVVMRVDDLDQIHLPALSHQGDAIKTFQKKAKGHER